jgi:hypothetical protein
VAIFCSNWLARLVVPVYLGVNSAGSLMGGVGIVGAIIIIILRRVQSVVLGIKYYTTIHILQASLFSVIVLKALA